MTKVLTVLILALTVEAVGILKEEVSAVRWTGVALIMIGAALVKTKPPVPVLPTSAPMAESK